MGQQSIYERIMNRRDGEPGDDAIALGGAAREQETATERGNEETNTVKTHNRLLLMSSAGVVILGIFATAVLAQQKIISLPSYLVAQKDTPATAPKVAGPTGRAAAPTAAAADASAAPDNQQQTIFNNHVEQAGVKACKDVFPALGFAAAAGSTFNATTSWSDKNPDQHSISSIVGMSFNTDQFKGSGASLVFSAPTPAKDGCEGTFVRVVPVAQDCNTFLAGLPKDSKIGNSLQGLPVITTQNGLQIILMPSAGNGCVVMTTSRAATTGS